MNCYRGRTYCPYYETCRHKNVCDRPLTPEVRKAAENAELPISQYAERPCCHVEYKETEE